MKSIDDERDEIESRHDAKIVEAAEELASFLNAEDCDATSPVLGLRQALRLQNLSKQPGERDAYQAANYLIHLVEEKRRSLDAWDAAADGHLGDRTADPEMDETILDDRRHAAREQELLEAGCVPC